MMVGLFCIAITKEEFRVSAMSGMDLFVITFIVRRQLDIIIGGYVLGVAVCPFYLWPLSSKTFDVFQVFTSPFVC